jgi:hypothetical protein
VAVSSPVRRYYAEHIFPKMGRTRVPPNFAPLDVEATGFATVEGCRARGKNILEVGLVGTPDRVEDIRMGCGLCNPAMYVAADIVADWARGRLFEEILARSPLDTRSLEPFFEALSPGARPEDAREKFQYVLFAVQNAVRDHVGLAPEPEPDIPEPADREPWDVIDD